MIQAIDAHPFDPSTAACDLCATVREGMSGYLGPDSFTYYDTDSMNMMSNTATVSLSVEYSVSSATDLTKQVAIDPLDTAVQILGSSGGAPATAHNLSLAYDSVAAQPDAVIQGMFQFNTNTPIPDTPTGTLTFNGVAQPATYVNLSGMNGTAHTFDLSYFQHLRLRRPCLVAGTRRSEPYERH